LSSSTPVRRSSPRLATSADASSETLVCSSSAKPSNSSRRSLKRTSADSSAVQTDSNRNRTSGAGTNIIQPGHHRQLRNSVVRRSGNSHTMNDISQATHKKPCVPNMFSSRRFSVSDEKPIDSDELAARHPVVQRRKGWPKGKPRKKQVICFCSQ